MTIDVDMMRDENSKASTEFSQTLQEMRDQKLIYRFTVDQRYYNQRS